MLGSGDERRTIFASTYGSGDGFPNERPVRRETRHLAPSVRFRDSELRGGPSGGADSVEGFSRMPHGNRGGRCNAFAEEDPSGG